MSVLAAIGAGLGTAGTLTQTAAPIIGPVAGAMSKAGKTYRKDLHSRADQLASGQLGYTEAQRRQAYLETRRAAEAQGASPAQAQQLAAQNMMAANITSQDQAISQAGVIRGDLKEHRDKVARDWTAGADAGGKLGEQAGEMMTTQGTPQLAGLKGYSAMLGSKAPPTTDFSAASFQTSGGMASPYGAGGLSLSSGK